MYSIAIGVENKMDYQPSEIELPGATCTFDSYTSVSNIESAVIKVDLGAAASAEDLKEIVCPEFEDYSGEEARVPDTQESIAGIRSKKSIFSIFSSVKAAILGLDRDKVDVAGGDIANTTVSEFTEETSSFPTPEPGESLKSLWGKVKKFIEDFKAWYTGVCLIGHIVNNCTSTANNLPLAAAQGKALMDLYTQLYSDLQTAKSDVGTLDQKLSSYFPVKQKLQLDFTEHSYGYINKNATYVEDYGIDIVDHNFQSGITTTLRISDGKLRVIKRSADGTESYKDIINI